MKPQFLVLLFSLWALAACQAPAVSHLAGEKASQASKAVWSEQIPFAEVEAYLPRLKELGTDLYIAIPPSKMEQPELFSLLRAAKVHGVRVNAWMLMGPEDGYWANKWNVDNLIRNVRNLLSILDNQGLAPEWITIDMEPKMEILLTVKKQLAAYDVKGLKRSTKELAESASLKRARTLYRNLVDEVHRRGIKVHVVTMPLVIDDMMAGGERLQNVLGLPIEGIGWDRVSFMLYRPFFAEMIGKVSPYLIYSYAADARRLFGDKVAVDLGPLGADGGDPLGSGTYHKPEEIHEDMAAARAAGVKRLHIFSLDGIHRVGRLPEWLDAPPARKPSYDLKVASFRKSLGLLTKVLPEPAQ